MAEEKEKIDPNVQKIAAELAKNMHDILKDAQYPNEVELASQPFRTERKKKATLVIRPDPAAEIKTQLTVIETETFLDKLFVNETRDPLNGIPKVIQMGIVGVSGSGKSILVQEMALKLLKKYKVCFVTSEDAFKTDNERLDLQSRLKQKADALQLDWEELRKNLYVFDTVRYSQLRDWYEFVNEYRALVDEVGIQIIIVDSITLMETRRGALKRRILELSRYNQAKGITGLYVCQRSVEETDKFAMAGGMGVAHNLDSVICIDFGKASGVMKAELGKKQWELTHFTRMLSCRLCGFNRHYYECEIVNGFLRVEI